MEKLEIVGNIKSRDSISRTIRLKGETFDKINEISEKKGISFNNVINQIIEFGIQHIKED